MATVEERLAELEKAELEWRRRLSALEQRIVSEPFVSDKQPVVTGPIADAPVSDRPPIIRKQEGR